MTLPNWRQDEAAQANRSGWRGHRSLPAPASRREFMSTTNWSKPPGFEEEVIEEARVGRAGRRGNNPDQDANCKFL